MTLTGITTPIEIARVKSGMDVSFATATSSNSLPEKSQPMTDLPIYRCRLHGLVTSDEAVWGAHLELHKEEFLTDLSTVPFLVTDPEKKERAQGLRMRLRPSAPSSSLRPFDDPTRRHGGALCNSTADTMRGAAGGGVGSAARTHGIRLKDHGWTPVGKSTLTREEWMSQDLDTPRPSSTSS